MPPSNQYINYNELPRIGPGLGCRSKIWMRVYNRLYNNEELQADPLTAKEKLLLQQLAFPNINHLAKSYKDHPNALWLTFIPSEYRDYYESIFEELANLSISEREVIKIDKDVPRTYGLFARNSKMLKLTIPENTISINIATELPPRHDSESDLRNTNILRSTLQQALSKPSCHIMTAYYISLKNILLAISFERGYCQGINFMVAALLLHFPYEREVYTIMAYLMKYRFVGILFDPKYSSLLDYIRIFEKKLRKHNRRIYRHFKKTEFTAVSYTIEWFTTCFIVSSPGELSLCVLDMLIAGFDNIMLKIGLSLLDHLEEALLALDFESLHANFKNMMMTADPIAVMARALCINIGTSNNLLRDMAHKIDSIDPSANGNLKFSRLSTMKIVERDPLDQSMNSSVDQFNISQISLRSSEDDAHKYADDEAPHHPIANPDSNLLHSALKPTKHVNKKKSRKDRNDFIKTRMHRSSKSSKSRSFDMTAADVGGGSVKFNLGGNSAATAPSSSAKMTSKKSSQQDAVHPPITPIPNTLKHIDNYSPLSPPPPMTPISKGTNNENTHENSGMWGSFVSSFSGMSKMLTPKTPSRTPFSRSKDTVGTNTTTPFSVSASQSKIPNNSLLSTPLRFPPVTPHKLPTPHYSAATQSLLFSPKYVPSTSKAPPSSSTMKKQGHVVVRHNLQTYSVNGSDASSGSMSDTSSGDSEEDEQNEEEDPGKQRLFASPKRFANKRLMSFLYKHNFSEDLQHGGKHHRRHSRTYLIAGYCSYCGCVDLEEDYDGEVETSKVQLIPNSAYFVNRNSANVILFSEEGSTIECQTSRKNRLVIRSLQSTQDLSDQGGEVVPDDYYVHNTIISNVTIFDSWFNSTGKRVSCGNRNIRKSTIRCHRYAHKGKNNNSQVSMTVTKDSKDVFAKLAILLQAIPQSTSPNDDENDDDSS